MNSDFEAMCSVFKKMMRQGGKGSGPKKKKNAPAPPIAVGSVRASDTQANALNTMAGLLRSTKMKCSERGISRVVKIHETADAGAQAEGVHEGDVVDVILITEGLGNRRNMNYYGPEAIESAPAVFEGKPCYLDHPSESEERDIPERRVRQKCGYFKNCRVTNIENAVACVGELHFDLSDDGEQAYRKACTALHYKDEFPGGSSEYVGLSINADGDVEDRTVQWQGETLQVNYVTRFRDAMSCDIVTTPARGGRFLALVESAAGAKSAEEVGPMKNGLKKALEAAHTALESVENEKDPQKKAAKALEATKTFAAFLKEGSKAAYQDESEGGESKMKQDESGESEDAGEGDDAGDSHTTVTHKVVKKTGKAAVPESSEDGEESEDDASDKKDDGDGDDDTVESHRVAIAALAKESGLDLPKGKLERLAAGSIKEARQEIAEIKWMMESTAKKVLKQIQVPVVTLAKVTESESGSNGSEGKSLLESCIR